MPTLRQCLKRPAPYLACAVLFYALVCADTFREPEQQVTGRLFVDVVSLYQEYGHLVLRGHVQCRFAPTCSHYSQEAVRRFGIRRGLILSYQRVRRCQPDVPFGTHDPVPDPDHVD
ncbi:MAG: membrane protein insertion efficiency factor YidD [Pseudomonadota bacterium]